MVHTITRDGQHFQIHLIAEYGKGVVAFPILRMDSIICVSSLFLKDQVFPDRFGATKQSRP